MLIVGIDPGLITGLFWVDTDVGVCNHREDSGIAIGKSLRVVMRAWLNNAYGVESQVLVGCEKYIITAHSAKTNQPEALENTGIVRFVCDEVGSIPLHLIIKANAMKIASNDRLKSVGWWGRGKTHGNDAARVALATLAQHRPGVFQRLPGVIQ